MPPSRSSWLAAFCVVGVVASTRFLALAQGDTGASPPSATPSPSLERGLVGAWRGDDGGADRTGRNPGQITGTPTTVPAMVGMGLRFSGPDDGLMVPDSDSLKLTGSLTISCWVFVEQYPTAEQGASMLVFRGDDRNGADPYHLEITPAGRVRFGVEAGPGLGAEVSAPIEAKRYVLVTVTLDAATGRLRLYENGKVVAETTTTFTAFGDLDPGANPGLGIGNHSSVPRSPFRYAFRGVLNEVLLYNRALGAAEVEGLFADRTRVAAIR